MAEGDAFGGSAYAAQGEPVQYTKRKQFLFFKIRSKPVYPKNGSGPGMRRTEPYEWIAALVAAGAVVLVMRLYQFPLLVAAIASVLVYALVFGLFLMADSRKARTDSMKSQIKQGMVPRTAAEQNRASVQQAVHAAGGEKPRHGWQARPAVPAAKVQTYAQKKQAVAGSGKDDGKAKGPIAAYIKGVITSKKDLEMDLREVGIKKSPYEFVKTMMTYAIIITVVVVVALSILLLHFGIPVILAPLMGVAVYMMSFNRFMMYPSRRGRMVGKLVERDILFAARDVVIGMRSGMPLYNAMTAVSTGYGETSRQFGRIIEMVQLGLPIEQAMEEVSAKSESSTFKRLMLQASTSIKAGVDVTDAIQGVVDEVMQERVIDLRRYGQKLNALAMFYMLFGVIFPSMGIAVATIMSTFINIFPITYVVLIIGLIFIAFVQIVLLSIMKSSRPIFVM